MRFTICFVTPPVIFNRCKIGSCLNVDPERVCGGGGQII